MTTVKTPLEIANLELAAIDAGIAQLTATYTANADVAETSYNLQLANKTNQKAAKETQIATLEAAE